MKKKSGGGDSEQNYQFSVHSCFQSRKITRFSCTFLRGFISTNFELKSIIGALNIRAFTGLQSLLLNDFFSKILSLNLLLPFFEFS